MRRKGLGAIALSVLLAATMTACTSTGEVSEKIVESIVEVKVPIEYYDVTAVNGLIADKDYNHEKVEKEQSVTVVAEAKDGIKDFIGWYIGDDEVSTELSYTFTPEADTLIMALYDTKFSVWSGDYLSDEPAGYVENDEEKTWHITSADGLAYWAAKVTATKDGYDPNNAKYSTFNYQEYSRDLEPLGGDNASLEDKRRIGAQSMHEDNAWTLSLEANIDLAGYEWTPIYDTQWGLNGFTFEGNGHIIKNLYAKAIKYVGQKAGGFFGEICNDDFAVKNVTFTNASIVSDEVNGVDQNLAVVIGYLNPNMRHDPYETVETVIFDNVNVYDSFIGGSSANKMGFLVGRSGEWSTDRDYVQYFFLNCNVSGNRMAGQRIFGGLIGYATHAGDGDISPLGGGQLTINVYNTTVNNNTVITNWNSNVNGIYNFGSICSGDASVGAVIYTENLKGMENTVIDLHIDSSKNWKNTKVAATSADLKYFLEEVNEDESHKYKEIFVVRDIDMSEISDMLDWTANTKQVVYLFAGAKVAGLDLGDNVRYISGERNKEGKLIVTDKDGEELGVWEVAADGTSGAFVAKATEPATEE